MLPESILRHPLPPVPDWFRDALAKVATRNGMPMFRLVDGLHELTFRNGKMDVKHLLKSVCYVPVAKTRYRRTFHGSDKFLIFRTHQEAKNAKVDGLSTVIESATINSVAAVGRACWIVEVYESPEEIDYDSWQALRYDYLEKSGVTQKIDLLGEYPRDGRYIACFDVVDSDGNAVSPSDKTIEECKRRYKLAMGDTRTAEEAIQGSNADIEKAEQKQIDRLNENFFQYAGITENRARGGVVGKPIKQTI